MKHLIDEINEYIRLDARDHALLRELHARLAPHFPAIADVAPAQLDRPALIDWMATGLLGPQDGNNRYLERGLPQHVMFKTVNCVRTAYVDRIIQLYPVAEAREIIRAVNKLLDVELAIMMRQKKLDAVQTLSNGLAHEVRNPLNAAALQLELLERRLRRCADDPKLFEPIDVANHELTRLTAMLNDFLLFARPPELHVQEQDVVDVLNHVVELERGLAQRRRVELKFPYHAPLTAPVDCEKLHQIVQNLVRNGLEATPPGRHVELAITDHTQGAFRITVCDDGPGIPADVLPRIYEPFFSTKESGTGMGMAIVHSLVTLLGGKIDVATSPSGTRFDVDLPRG